MGRKRLNKNRADPFTGQLLLALDDYSVDEVADISRSHPLDTPSNVDRLSVNSERGAKGEGESLDVESDPRSSNSSSSLTNNESSIGLVASRFDGIFARFPFLLVHQFYKPGSIKAELVSKLNECLRDGTVPRSKHNITQINRKHFSFILDVTPSAMTFHKEILRDYETAFEVVEPVTRAVANSEINADSAPVMNDAALLVASKFPELLKHQHYPNTRLGYSKAKLVSALNDFLRQGRVPRSRSNAAQINRQYFALKIGVSAATVYYQEDILRDYEAVLEIVEPVSSIEARSNFGEGSDRNRPLDEAASHVVSLFPELLKHQYYENTTGRGCKALLVSALNDCLRKGKVPRSKLDRTQINRKHFASAANVSVASVFQCKGIIQDYEAILESVEPVASLGVVLKFGGNTDITEPVNEAGLYVISQYPQLSKHQYYPSGSAAASIVDILNAQIRDGALKRSRGGKIDRRKITAELKLSKSSITNYLIILTDYEDSIGERLSVAEAKIPAMRTWFQKQFLDGTLEIRDGKVSRIQFFAEFGFPKTNAVFVRYPKLLSLIEEFDTKVDSTRYQPRDVVDILKKLGELLSGDFPIGKDRRTVNRVWVAEQLGISKNTLRQSPYFEVIEAAERNLHGVQQRDPLMAFAGGRWFETHRLLKQGWARAYAIQVTSCFAKSFRNKPKDDAKTCFAGLMDLLSYTASSNSESCRALLIGLSSDVSVKSLERDFAKATQEYRDHLRGVYDNDASCNGKIAITNKIIRIFSGESILPPLELQLIGFREDNSFHLRSIGEAPERKEKRTNPHVDDYLKFAMAMLEEAATVRQIDLITSDQGDFTRALREELEADEFAATDSPASVIQRILDRRVKLIQAAAWEQVERGQKDLEAGQLLLDRAIISGEDFDRIIDAESRTSHGRRRLLRRYFPNNQDKEQGIANLLEPDLKGVERYQQVVIPICCRDDRGFGWPGMIPLVASIAGNARAIQVI